jgi:hypothetical protein
MQDSIGKITNPTHLNLISVLHAAFWDTRLWKFWAGMEDTGAYSGILKAEHDVGFNSQVFSTGTSDAVTWIRAEYV